MTAPDFCEALAEVIESNAAWAVDPVSSQVDAVLALLAERLGGDALREEVLTALLRTNHLNRGQSVDAALTAVREHLIGERS